MKYLASNAAVMAAVVALSLAGAGQAAVRSDPCLGSGGHAAQTVMDANIRLGFRGYFSGIGTASFRKEPQPSAALLGAGKLCGSSAVVAAAATARSDQSRFYVLYRAFPSRPSKAQWVSRFHSLVMQAAKVDADFLALLKVMAIDEIASERASLHCGVPPNPPNICDNETEVNTVAGFLANEKPTLDAVAADRTWLLKEARVSFPAR